MGTVEFGIQYMTDSQKLVVDLVRVFDLPIGSLADSSSSLSEFYCKCTLLPDKIAYQSRAVKRSANPIFEQQFEFDYLDLGKMDARFLEISIHELDKSCNKDECMGVSTLKLNLPNIETKSMFVRDFKPWIRNSEVCAFFYWFILFFF